MGNPPRERPGTQRQAQGGNMPWVNTGESVSKQYSEFRKDAVEHMKARNVYFEQATKAYLSGNKALARELSHKGQLLNEQMKLEHKKAAQAIFTTRNAGLQAEGDIQVLDLHGLHVREGISFLRNTLQNVKRSGSFRMNVLVGTKHHTKAHHSS